MKRFVQKLRDMRVEFNHETIRIKTTCLDIDTVVESLLRFQRSHKLSAKAHLPTLYHIDLAFEVFQNVDMFLFYLVVTSTLRNSVG